MIARLHKHSRIFLLFNVMQWRVVDQEVVRAGLVREPVLRLPEMAARELMESEHVRHWYLWDCCGEKVGALVRGNRYQCATVRTTKRDKVLIVCQTFQL